MRELAIPVDHLLPYVRHAERTGSALMLTGPSGIGKTEFTETLARESRRLCCTKIFAAMGVEDIALAGPTPGDNFINFMANKGFPFVGTEKIWLHPESGLPPYLFTDELNNTIPYMQNAILQLYGERAIHGIPLIPGTTLIGAGNRAADAAHITKMSGPLANRLVHLYVDPPTLDGFRSYCLRHNVNEFVAAYHDHTGGERIHRFDADQFLVEPAFPSPRAWVRGVGPILDNPHLSDTERMVLVGGAIGFGESQDFEVFYRLRKELPNLDAILAGGDAPIPKNVSTKVLVINSLVRRSTHQNVHHVFKYISKLASHDPEYADLFEKSLFIKDPTFAGNPAYTKWVLQMNRQPIVNTASQRVQPQDQVPPVAPEATPDPQQVPSPTPTQSVQDILKSLPPVNLPKRRI